MELLSASYPLARDLLRKSLTELEAAEPKDLRAITAGAGEPGERRTSGPRRRRGRPSGTDRPLHGTGTARYRLPDDAGADRVRVPRRRRRDDARPAFAEAVARFRDGPEALCDRVGPATDQVRFNLLAQHRPHPQGAGRHPRRTAEALDAGGEAPRPKFAEPGDITGGLIAAVRADILTCRTGEDSRGRWCTCPVIEKACRSERRDRRLPRRHGEATSEAMDRLEERGDYRRGRKRRSGSSNSPTSLAEAEKHVLFARSLNYLGIVNEVQGRDGGGEEVLRGSPRRSRPARTRCPPVTQCITLWRLAVLADKAGEQARRRRSSARPKSSTSPTGHGSTRSARRPSGPRFTRSSTTIFEQLARWHAQRRRGRRRDAGHHPQPQPDAPRPNPGRRRGPPRPAGRPGPRRAPRPARAIDRPRERSRGCGRKAQFLDGRRPEGEAGVGRPGHGPDRSTRTPGRKSSNADPVTRALTDQANIDDGARLRAAERTGRTRRTAVLAYLVGRDRELRRAGAGRRPGRANSSA